MSYDAPDFMDDVCAALVDAKLVTHQALKQCEEDSGAVATLAIAAINRAAQALTKIKTGTDDREAKTCAEWGLTGLVNGQPIPADTPTEPPEASRTRAPAHEDRLKLRLSIDVTYDRNGVSEEELHDILAAIPRFAAGEGWFTSETPAEVDSWNAIVVTVPPKGKPG